MTQRNRAENVTEEELNKLVFEPFANPFRVYELYRDVEAFIKVVESGSDVYCFNSRGYWKESDDELEAIPLKTSLTLQTAILTDALEWEPWDMLPGSMIPTKESVEKVLPATTTNISPKHAAIWKNTKLPWTTDSANAENISAIAISRSALNCSRTSSTICS